MKEKFQWKRSFVCLALVAVVLVIYELRLVQWQLIEGDEYSKISDETTSFHIKLDAARGEILDKNGEPMAGNKTCYNIVMNAVAMDSDRNPAILECIRFLDKNKIKWVDKLPIKLDSDGRYSFIKDREDDVNYLKSADMLNMQKYATAEECMKALIEKYDCDGYAPEDARDIISVRYNMTKVQFSRSEPYMIAEDVPMDVVEQISEHSSSMPGIEVKVSSARDYSDGTIAPHILGSIGSITQEQYDGFAQEDNIYSSSNVSGYSYTDVLGQSGIEAAFESTLRGKNGKESISTNSQGDIIKSEITETPVAGNSVCLTIDKELQKVANKSLEKNIGLCNAVTGDCTAGGVVVLDVDTFGVLAASTYPTFDLGRYSEDDDYYYELIDDETTPLFNRAFNGIFTPGSVFKPLVAIAALEEGVIDENFTHYCPGYYDYYEEDNPPTCYNSIEHGTVDIYSALEQSCNVFFFDVGRQLTIDKMNVYADAFALGKETGLEISESPGIMSGPAEYLKNHGSSWVDGLTIQTAIGQCDSMFTPLQLAAYCATIANNGVRMDTHLYSKTLDYDGEQVLDEYKPKVACDTKISMETLKTVQKGMRYVCKGKSGTAYDTFGDYGIAVAAKTGTAENHDHSDNTVFMAYAPYDDPEIAVAVVLEYGKVGDYSQAVAKDIFDMYFYGKDNNKDFVSSTEIAEESDGDDKDESDAVSEEDSEPQEEDDEAPSEEEYSEGTSAVRGDDIPDPEVT